MGRLDEANSSFSTALCLWPSLAAGWLSWGSYCDAMFTHTTGDATWLEYAVTCYLQVSTARPY